MIPKHLTREVRIALSVALQLLRQKKVKERCCRIIWLSSFGFPGWFQVQICCAPLPCWRNWSTATMVSWCSAPEPLRHRRLQGKGCKIILGWTWWTIKLVNTECCVNTKLYRSGFAQGWKCVVAACSQPCSLASKRNGQGSWLSWWLCLSSCAWQRGVNATSEGCWEAVLERRTFWYYMNFSEDCLLTS